MSDDRASFADLLDRVSTFFGRYLALPSEHCLTVVTLWAAHTHAIGAFYVTPRLVLDSAEPGSGKTRVLELLRLLTNKPIMSISTTTAALYRRLAEEPRTVLLDETDALFGKNAAPQHEDLRALLNSGYKRGATVDRCVGDASKMKVIEFPVFGAVALAGLAGAMPATITTRAVTIHMRKRAPGERVEPFRERDAEYEAWPLREGLADWMGSLYPELDEARPVMPDGVVDRPAEVWEALLAVADAAGGEWGKRAREACRYFVLDADPGELSMGVRLLADLRALFAGRDRMTTEEILAGLIALDEAPWSSMWGKPLDSRGLAKLLGKYGVKSVNLKQPDSKVLKGYGIDGQTGLHDAWSRYLPTSATSATSATSQVNPVADGIPVADTSATGPGAATTLSRQVADVAEVAAICRVCGRPLDFDDGTGTHPLCFDWPGADTS